MFIRPKFVNYDISNIFAIKYFKYMWRFSSGFAIMYNIPAKHEEFALKYI